MNSMKALAAALMASTTFVSAHASAQSSVPSGSSQPQPLAADTAASDQIGDIVVTALKRSDRLSDTPLSITAATGDQLTRQGITDPAGLEKIVPGFVFTKSAYSAPVYTIRGIGSYDEAIGISPTVSVYVDQVPLAFSRMTEGAAFDLERVEVLKGPQGTLFGQNSTGGAINYIAAKPKDHFEAGAELSFGRFAEADASGYITGPIADGITARLAVRTEQRGDWQRSYTRDNTVGQRDFTTGRFLLDLKPSSNLSFEFSASGWIDKSDTQAKQKIGYSPINPATPFLDSPGYPTLQADLAAYPNAPRDARAADWDSGLSLARDDSFYQFSLRGDLKLSNSITLTSISAYSHLKVYSPNDNDGTALPDSSIIVGGWINSFSQEVRLGGEFGGEHLVKWMVGGNYEYDHTNDTQFLFLRATNTGLRLPTGVFRWTQLNNLNDQRISTKAAFASLDVNLTSQLILQGSVRYTTQDRDFTGCLADSGNGEIARAFTALSSLLSGSPTTIAPGSCVTLDPTTNKPLANGVQTSLDQNNLSWRGGLSWKPNKDVLLYANVTKGYKAGSYGTLPAIRPIQAAPVTQESLLAYEAGFKVSLLDRKVQLSGAAFYYDYRDKQLLGSVNLGQPFGTLPALVSVPRSRVAGAELDATIRPTTGLTLRLAGSYIDSKVLGSYVLADPLPALRPTGIDIGGSAFPNTPKWQGSADAEYRAPVSTSWSAFGGFNLSYRSATRSFFGGDDNFILPGYALLDLRAGFERADGKLRVMFWGRNVTNKFYKTFVSRATDTIFQNVGMPVTYGVTVSTKF
jgi:outer membrane receptor protein involved in Fe transport